MFVIEVQKETDILFEWFFKVSYVLILVCTNCVAREFVLWPQQSLRSKSSWSRIQMQPTG